jgi:hypothetical protein
VWQWLELAGDFSDLWQGKELGRSVGRLEGLKVERLRKKSSEEKQ